MKIITGYRGEAHITSLQDRAANQGTYGTGSYVLDVGAKMAAEAASANEIRISDGILSHQGCVAIIEPGTYDSVAISNGMQGMNRIDRIVARYTKNAETNIESLELFVIEGTPSASTPTAPSYTTGQIQNGALVVDMPLYNVQLSGITVSSVDKQFSTVRTQAETDTLLGNTSISGIGGGTVTGAISKHEGDISTLNSNIKNHSAATTISGATGACYYSKVGDIVVFSFVLNFSSALAANTDIVSGLPRNDYGANGMFYVLNNNAVASYFRAILTSDGKIRVAENIPAGSSLRGMGAYINF